MFVCTQTYTTLTPKYIFCRKKDLLKGPRVHSCLTLRNELSKETLVLTKQETLGGTRVKSSRYGNPGEPLCHVAHSLGFMVIGLVSVLSLVNHSDSQSLLMAWASLARDAFQPGVGGDMDWHRLFPFDLSWILVSGGLLVLFFTRTSFHKISHTSGCWWCLAKVSGFSQCFP